MVAAAAGGVGVGVVVVVAVVVAVAVAVVVVVVLHLVRPKPFNLHLLQGTDLHLARQPGAFHAIGVFDGWSKEVETWTFLAHDTSNHIASVNATSLGRL